MFPPVNIRRAFSALPSSARPMGFVEGCATLKLASSRTAQATDDASDKTYKTLITSAIRMIEILLRQSLDSLDRPCSSPRHQLQERLLTSAIERRYHFFAPELGHPPAQLTPSAILLTSAIERRNYYCAKAWTGGTAPDPVDAISYKRLMTSAIERRNYLAPELGQLGQPLVQLTPSAIRDC